MSAALKGVRKTYSTRRRGRAVTVTALDGVDVEVGRGELLVVAGPSGSGKSTLLRCIAGLERPDEGRVEVDGKDVTDVPAGRRDIAMVFQDYALYPHISVQANISFGLKARRTPAHEIVRKANEAAEMLGLSHALSRRPEELSGGERQRVALARAIVRDPSVFLMDEPLSNLDAELRTNTRSEIRALQRRLGTTTVYVTHDQVEAMTMGDRVAVLREGRVEQIAPPTQLYDRPATAFVARFIGSPPMNLFPAALYGNSHGAPVLGIRPECIELVAPRDGRLQGSVRAVEPIGDVTIVHVDVHGHRFLVKTRGVAALALESEIGLSFAVDDLYEFDGMDGQAAR